MTKADDKLFETAKKRYKLALDGDSDARQKRIDDLRFSVLLEQWDEGIKNSRENDPNGARPCLVVDKTNQYIRQIVNDIRQNRPAMKVRAVNDDGDEDVAEIIQGLTRHIEDQSRADLAYDWASESAVRCGLGYFRIVTDYVGQNSFDQDIIIKRVMDINSVLMDPNSTEPDGCDAKYAFVTDTLSADEFEEAYPDAEAVNFDSDTEQEWFGDKKVLIAEYFWLEKQAVNILFLEDGSTKEEADYWAGVKAGAPKQKILKTRPTENMQCKWAKINGKEILEQKEFPSRYIPVFPVLGNEGFVSGKRVLSGVVRAAKDSQRLYNYVRSAFTEAVALAPKAPYIAAAGQIEEFEEWETANTTNHAVLRYKPTSVGGTPVPPPMRQPFAGIPAGLAQDMEIAERDIQSTMGMHEASKGENGAERSGIAIQSLQSKGDTSSFHYRDNLARAIQHLGRVVVEMIPKIYDTQRVLRIIGEDGEHSHAKINPEQPGAVEEQHDETGAITKIYNLGIGTYDVTVTVGPSYSTKRQEFAAMMGEMFSRDPQLMQMAGDLYFRSIDMPYSDQIADRLKKMLPPQLQDKPEGQPELPPEVQAQMEQMSNALHQSEQQMQQFEQHIQQLTFEQKAKMIESQAKIQEARIHAEAEAARAMADVEIAKVTAVDPSRLDAAEQILQNLMQQMSSASGEPDPIPEPQVDPLMQQLVQNHIQLTQHANDMAAHMQQNSRKPGSIRLQKTPDGYIAHPDQ